MKEWRNIEHKAQLKMDEIEQVKSALKVDEIEQVSQVSIKFTWEKFHHSVSFSLYVGKNYVVRLAAKQTNKFIKQIKPHTQR